MDDDDGAILFFQLAICTSTMACLILLGLILTGHHLI